MAIADLDRLLHPDYLDGVQSLPIADLRAKRAECQAVESKLSYVRRLVQGRLDIAAAELDRRAGGGPPVDASRLVADLPRILGEKVRAPGLGRLPTNLLPPDDDDDLTAELDAAAGPHVLGVLPSLSDEDVTALTAQLTALEARVSSQRRAIFGVIDALEGELARRYQVGEADPTSLLG